MKRFLAPAVFALFLQAAHAHEFWLTPDTYSPAAGGQVDVSLFIGEFYTGELVGVTAAHAASVRLISSGGAQDLAARVPAGSTLRSLRLPLPSAGAHMLVYDSHPSEVILSADKFHAYLHEEGLDAIIQKREASGTAVKEGRERFRRHAKLLLRVGERSDNTYSVRTGQRLEIVPLSDPLRAAAGDRIPWQLTFDGKPLTGVLVKAWHKQDQQVTVVRARSDRSGRLNLQLPFAGPWLLNVVHMIPADGVGVDWESHWGSLTFELAATKR